MKRYRCLVDDYFSFEFGEVYDEHFMGRVDPVSVYVKYSPDDWELVEEVTDKPNIWIVSDWVKCSDGCCDIDIYRIIENGEEVDVCDADPNSLIERLNSRYNLGFKFDRE